MQAKETIKIQHINKKLSFYFLSFCIIPCIFHTSLQAILSTVVRIIKIQEAEHKTTCSAIGMCC